MCLEKLIFFFIVKHLNNVLYSSFCFFLIVDGCDQLKTKKKELHIYPCTGSRAVRGREVRNDVGQKKSQRCHFPVVPVPVCVPSQRSGDGKCRGSCTSSRWNVELRKSACLVLISPALLKSTHVLLLERTAPEPVTCDLQTCCLRPCVTWWMR